MGGARRPPPRGASAASVLDGDPDDDVARVATMSRAWRRCRARGDDVARVAAAPSVQERGAVIATCQAG
jgi:hypothetical protein